MMRIDRRVSPLVIAIVAGLLLVTSTGAAGQALPTAAPASEGFAPDRLDRLHARMKQFVDDGQHAGILSLIARNGHIVDVQAWGLRDREQHLPMERNTIFRIYSMTKMVTTVAVMQLVEQGRIALDDPVGKYLPALASPKVFAGGTAKHPRLVAATRAVTIKDLLTHTSGYPYWFMYSKGPLDEIYKDAALADAKSLDEFIQRLSALPLAHQPGARFSYGIGLDVLGAVVQKVSGEKFEAYVADQVCGPLKMVDTAFYVPAEKRSRLATVYTTKDGALSKVTEPLTMTSVDAGGVPFGGAGLFSTIDDYARLGQALLNGGQLDGVRILGRKSVELMEANELSHMAKVTNQFSDSDGFGFGGAVRVELARGNRLGSVGQFGWTGAATTYFNIDPHEHTMVLVFTQHFPHNEHHLFEAFSTLFYASLVD
jgi:CubicO group peptidase (beta-lactamase class C family)